MNPLRPVGHFLKFNKYTLCGLVLSVLAAYGCAHFNGKDTFGLTNREIKDNKGAAALLLLAVFAFPPLGVRFDMNGLTSGEQKERARVAFGQQYERYGIYSWLMRRTNRSVKRSGPRSG